MTGLRFIAAFVVFGFHLTLTQLIGGHIGVALRWVFSPGAIGVSFFFILSGFVLTWSSRADDTSMRFWRRRVAKIYPDHLATWLPTLGVMAVTGMTLAPVAILANLFLVQAWYPNERVYYGMNTVSWSLACEMFFYALFPLLLRWLRRLPERRLVPAALIAALLVWCVPLLAHPLAPADRYWAIWVFPIARLPEFVGGMVLARIVGDGRWPRLNVAPVAAIAVAAYLASRWIPDDLRIVAFTAIPLALLIATVAAADVSERPTHLRSRAAIWLGEVSYAFYLVHQLVLRLVGKIVGEHRNTALGIAAAVAALVLTMVCSWALYRLVEQPGMRLLGPRRTADGGHNMAGATGRPETPST